MDSGQIYQLNTGCHDVADTLFCSKEAWRYQWCEANINLRSQQFKTQDESIIWSTECCLTLNKQVIHFVIKKMALGRAQGAEIKIATGKEKENITDMLAR